MSSACHVPDNKLDPASTDSARPGARLAKQPLTIKRCRTRYRIALAESAAPQSGQGPSVKAAPMAMIRSTFGAVSRNDHAIGIFDGFGYSPIRDKRAQGRARASAEGSRFRRNILGYEVLACQAMDCFALDWGPARELTCSASGTHLPRSNGLKRNKSRTAKMRLNSGPDAFIVQRPRRRRQSLRPPTPRIKPPRLRPGNLGNLFNKQRRCRRLVDLMSKRFS